MEATNGEWHQTNQTRTRMSPKFQDGSKTKSFIEVPRVLLPHGNCDLKVSPRDLAVYQLPNAEHLRICFPNASSIASAYGSQYVDVGSIVREQSQLLFQTWPKSNPLQTFLVPSIFSSSIHPPKPALVTQLPSTSTDNSW